MADISAGLGRSNAMDPQGRFFFSGRGRNIGFIDSCLISPVDGTARLPSSTVNLGPNPGNLPAAMFVDNSGSFLYVAQNTGDNVVAYSIDQATGALTQVQGPLRNVSLSLGTSVADPWARTFTLSLPSAASAFTFIKSTSSPGISRRFRDLPSTAG
jgi:hypothetical protein